VLLGSLRSACTPPARLLSHGPLPLHRLPWGTSIRHRRVGGLLPGSHRSAGVRAMRCKNGCGGPMLAAWLEIGPILNAVRPRRVPLLGPEGREYGITPAVARRARLKLRSFTSILHPARSPDERDAPHPRYVGHAAWLAWGGNRRPTARREKSREPTPAQTMPARLKPPTGTGFPPSCAIQACRVPGTDHRANREAEPCNKVATTRYHGPNDQAGENYGRKD
jgi:hypothetical protein